MKKLLAFTALTAMALTGTAHAQSSQFPMVTSVEGNYVGLGTGFVPDYSGSDDYTGGVAPMFRYGFGGQRYVELLGNYASVNILDNDNWRFGPAVQYRFGRDNDVEDNVVDNLPDIDDSVEVGAFLTYTKILNNNPRNRFAVGVDVLQDVSDGHEGLVGTASVRYWDQVSKAIDLGISVGTQYGSEDFTDSFFGVSAAGAAASGLNQYDADGGIKSYRVMPMAVMHLSEDWHVGAGVRWERLVGDAADSPIVDDRGSENQFIGGIGIAYSWGGKVNTR